ncbi:hypothetical protein [Massilia sp. YIM B02443]|uniref:hypothetical protein n=1 Tax=Massilia sp. YIM B02443 TaxID=3050127 RepID=UPI0025B674C0|nr:hypothetical protein [Massilia sp. YIM B02443]MDN4035447.1 hypothetical protein [Massilia sp. YIM B02443]
MTSAIAANTGFTLNDIDIGLRVFDALAHHAHAMHGAPITYTDLLTLARKLQPKDAALGRAVPVGIGMKLRFVSGFCAAYGHPDLACLAVNRATMRPATGDADAWEAECHAVAAVDWSAARPTITTYADTVRATVPARLKPRKERPADVAWYAYFCSHRSACDKVTQHDKQEIINLIMAGLDPDTSLRRVLAAKADFSEEP